MVKRERTNGIIYLRGEGMGEFKSETEIIGYLQVCGASYSIAVLLNRMVKEKHENAEKRFVELGGKFIYPRIYEFHHGKIDK